MNYGLYLSAAGVLTNRYRQDVFANNLANVNTHGFKPLTPSISNRPPEAIENPDRFGTAHELLDRLGGGVLAGPQSVDFTPGPIEVTGNPLDAALPQADTFFAVQTTDPATGRVDTRLSRDGRFTVNADGQLTTHAGHRVLGDDGQPISVPAGVRPAIDAAGRLIDPAGKSLATLRVLRVPEPGDALIPQAGGMFAFKARDTSTPVELVDLKPGALERSGTQAVPTLMKLIAASKAAMGNANMIRYHDTLLDRAVNTLGRVA
jgi:flagellar basal body rod protein FlgG